MENAALEWFFCPQQAFFDHTKYECLHVHLNQHITTHFDIISQISYQFA